MGTDRGGSGIVGGIGDGGRGSLVSLGSVLLDCRLGCSGCFDGGFEEDRLLQDSRLSGAGRGASWYEFLRFEATGAEGWVLVFRRVAGGCDNGLEAVDPSPASGTV